MNRLSLLLVLLLSGFTVTGFTKDVLKETFVSDEIVEVDKIIAFYDNFVISKFEKKISVKKAYQQFWDDHKQRLSVDSDIDYMAPDEEQQMIFFRSLSRKVLEEFFIITDTVCIYNSGTKRKEPVYHPYTLSVNSRGKYMQLLEKLTTRNDFFKDFHENIIQVGGLLSPLTFKLLYEGIEKGKINFDKKRRTINFHYQHVSKSSFM